VLFDLSPFRASLPEGVQVFASGASRLAEIRGFAKLGAPVGVAINQLNHGAIEALIELQQPVMIDSGAFSEVTFESEGFRVVARISDEEWRRRLAIYSRLARPLREKAMLVVPDQVANQQETIRRLATFRPELIDLAGTGARLLLPLQVGEMSHSEFLRAAESAAGVPLTPAMPMRKAATSTAALIDFMQEQRPRHIHLLGMGIDNRHAGKLLHLIRHFSPGTTISMDSNRLRAVTGRDRPLTRLETELRSATTERIYGAVDSPVLTLTGDLLDYTDLLASPSLWCTPQQLGAIAASLGMLSPEADELRRNPDDFLQTAFRDNEEISWIEHPLMELELDRAWEQYIDDTIRSSVRTAAIVHVFQDSRIRKQCA
jgi:hypothetical protein